jgi:ribonuclease BN (tRNA processing enzyme)
VRLEHLGVRGSTAAPGAEFARYGGHTSCVALTAEGADRPGLVLDAGTGLRKLTAILAGAAYDGAIVLSHLHWDHVQGLPFFAAGDRDDARVDLYLPAQEGRSGRDLLAQTLSPPAFPITPEGLRGTWGFHAIEAGGHAIEGFTVRTVDIEHKGGRTFGLRVDDELGSIAYLPDHAPAAGMSEELLEMLSGVDVLLHDAQFLEGERPVAVDYGHATVQDAVSLGLECGVGTLVLFHHSPARTDEALDEIGAWAPSLAGSMRVVVAREGDALQVAGQSPAAPAPSSV